MNQQRRNTYSLTAAAVGLTLACCSSVTLAAGMPTLLGKIQYRSSCASCHGAEGAGDGPVAADLKTQPTNLTTIAANNGGTFPSDTVYQIIDGRQSVRAHGTSDMPVWGDVYSAQVDSTGGGGESGASSMQRKAAVNGRILSLVYYLESIQAK